jgi:hypothetical protein
MYAASWTSLPHPITYSTAHGFLGFSFRQV